MLSKRNTNNKKNLTNKAEMCRFKRVEQKQKIKLQQQIQKDHNKKYIKEKNHSKI